MMRFCQATPLALRRISGNQASVSAAGDAICRGMTANNGGGRALKRNRFTDQRDRVETPGPTAGR